jgi:hypothetical protein
MPRKLINYDNTIIYKLCCNDVTITDIYIGHTTNFVKRKQNHKYSCNSSQDKGYNYYIYEFIRNNGGWNNWSMIEIIKIKCVDVYEACKIERQYMEELNATLNKLKPIILESEKQDKIKEYRENYKEYNKEYREDNKEYYKEYNKKYKEDNKNKIKEYNKKYSEDNKEKLNECRKKYNEINKEKRKEYNEINKDKIKERRRKYYQNNKDKIKECQNENNIKII